MNGFYGQFEVTLDDKGRISLPSKLRPTPKKDRKDKETFVLTKGLDGCLALYPKDQWELIQKRLDSLSFTSKDFRFFSRQLHSVAVLITLDRQGRMLIPSNLQQNAGLEKEVLVLGAYRWIEIWNPSVYRDYLEKYGQSYEEVAEKLFDFKDGQTG